MMIVAAGPWAGLLCCGTLEKKGWTKGAGAQ